MAAAPGRPLLNNVIQFPGQPGASLPTITTDGGDLRITSATGKVIVDGTLVATLQSFGAISGGGGGGNVFPAGINVTGGNGVFANLAIFSSGLNAPNGNISLQNGSLILSGPTNANVIANGGGFFGEANSNTIIVASASGSGVGGTYARAVSGFNTNVDIGLYAQGAGRIILNTGDGLNSGAAVFDVPGSTNVVSLMGGATPSVGSFTGDLQLAPASGILQIGQSFPTSGTPGSFSAAEIWTIKNAAGNLRYVPVATGTW